MFESTVEIENFIGGEFRSSSSFIESHNPATGEVLALVPDSDSKCVDEAVSAAKLAFKGWSSMAVSRRVEILRAIADAIESRLDEFAKAESMDQGKPLAFSRSMDIPRVLTNFRVFCDAILCEADKAISQPENGILNYTIHEPVGVTVLVVPWNFPLLLLTFKLAPALLYGNTVVVKPSEFTSLTTWMLSRLFKECDLPDGVVNIVYGYGSTVGESLINHSDVRLISFTGSTKTGCHIAEVAGRTNKKVSLEMGGKNAAVVFADADLLACVPVLIRSSFINQGQVCLSTSRIFVQRSIYHVFVELFVKEAKSLKIGDPLDAETFLGPLCSLQHMNKVKSYIDQAKQDGAKFLLKPAENLNLPQDNTKGYFIPPVILGDVSDSSRYMQEEIFGPITCVVPFDTEEEVVERVNNVQYGLCASVWSSDVKTVHNIATKLEVGSVWMNCWMTRNLHMPFGGSKMSGNCREGTEDSREFYTNTKTVCLKYD